MRSFLRSEVLVYFIIAAALAVVALMSLHRSGYIMGGDTWPGYFMPGNQTVASTLQVWGTASSGLGSPQFDPTALVWGAWGQLWLGLGIPGPTVQFLFNMVLLVAEGLGVAFFALAVFPERRVIALASGLALPLSLYNTLVFQNPIQAFAIAFFPWIAGFLLHRTRRPVTQLRFAGELGLAGLAWLVLSDTPPLAVFALAWVLVWVVVSWYKWKTIRQTWGGLILGALLTGLMQAWWLYGAYLTLFGSGGSVQQTFAGALAWGWVEQRASLWNLLSMQGLWAWPQTAYYPWATPYVTGVLRFSVYVPLVFAVVGALWNPFRRRVGVLVGVLVLSLFIAKGLHGPLASWNKWLYLHLPLFWLLRDPQTEANITLYLALFVLAGVGLSEVLKGLVTLLAKWVKVASTSKMLVLFVGTAMVLSQCLSGYAFASGAFIPRSALGGEARPVVNVPSYWFEAAKFLNSQPGAQRVLVLPNDDFYQMPYSWGYYGVDSVAQSLLHRSVIMLAPPSGGYLSGSSTFVQLQSNILHDMESAPNVAIAPVLRSLSVGWIVERQDVSWNQPGRSILSAPYVLWYLAHQPGVRKVATFGALVVYKVQGSNGVATMYGGVGEWMSPGVPDVSRAAALLGGDVPWLTQDHSVGAAAVSAYGFQVPPSLAWPALPTPTVPGKLWVTPATMAVSVLLVSPTRLDITLTGPQFSVDGRAVSWRETRSMTLPTAVGSQFALDVGQSQYFFDYGDLVSGHPFQLGTYTVASGTNSVKLILWTSVSGNLMAPAPWSSVGDCNDQSHLTLAAAGISATTLRGGAVQLEAKYDAACLIKRVTLRSGTGTVLVSLGYQNVEGSAPQVAVLLGDNVGRSVNLPASSQWQTLRMWVPTGAARSLSLYVYGFGSGNAKPTVDAYKSAAVWVMRVAGTSDASLAAAFDSIPAGPLLSVSGQTSGLTNLLQDATFTHGLWNPPINANAYKPMTFAAAGIKASVLSPGVLDLQAKYEAVGEGQLVTGVAGQLVRVSVEARTVRGQPPRAVLFDASGHPLWSSNFSAGDSNWQRESSTVFIPPSDNEVSLYLYAYGSGTLTEDQYRNLQLTPWPAGQGGLLWVGGQSPRSVSSQLTFGDSVTVHVATGMRLLVLSDAYSSGWVVAASGHVLKWRHVRVDGVLNGWLLPVNSPRTVTVYYAPAMVFHTLLWLAAVAFVAALGLASTKWTRRSKFRRHRKQAMTR